MSESELPVTAPQNPADDRPGHRLAEARKAKGLTLEEVASQLRLNVSMLQALENDDYTHLPPAAYVSGYVRSYARALGLSEAELLRSNTAAPSGEPPIVGVVARSHTAQMQANDPRVKLVSWLVFGGLLLISGAWWLVQRDEAPAVATEETVANVADTSAAAPEMAATVPGAVDAATSQAGTPVLAAVPTGVAMAPVPSPAVAAVPARPGAVAAPVPPGVGSAGVKPVVAPAPAPVVGSAPGTPKPAVVEPPKPAAPPPPPLTSNMAQSKVVLEFSADCWVDVVDAAGRQLVYELAPAGRKLRLRGEAPFTVFFGYSPGVRVSFNDQSFDHRPFQRKDMARFKLGTSEDNTQSTEAQ